MRRERPLGLFGEMFDSHFVIEQPHPEHETTPPRLETFEGEHSVVTGLKYCQKCPNKREGDPLADEKKCKLLKDRKGCFVAQMTIMVNDVNAFTAQNAEVPVSIEPSSTPTA